jgi:hypothetical protein
MLSHLVLFEVHNITFATFPDFADFATVLHGCGYFTNIDVPSAWNLPVPETDHLSTVEDQG